MQVDGLENILWNILKLKLNPIAPMRILQLIDSLEAGGAERMVNYANALTQQIECSGLVCTRKEGALKNQLDSKVAYLFLDKNTL
jgi:hypothetical protein